MDGEGMQVLWKLHFKGSKRIIFWKRINAQGWTLNLNWSDKQMNQCFGLQYTVFSHLSLALNMVQVIEGKNKYKRSQGK